MSHYYDACRYYNSHCSIGCNLPFLQFIFANHAKLDLNECDQLRRLIIEMPTRHQGMTLSTYSKISENKPELEVLELPDVKSRGNPAIDPRPSKFHHSNRPMYLPIHHRTYTAFDWPRPTQ